MNTFLIVAMVAVFILWRLGYSLNIFTDGPRLKRPCPKCGGSGYGFDDDDNFGSCPKCDGGGRVTE